MGKRIFAQFYLCWVTQYYIDDIESHRVPIHLAAPGVVARGPLDEDPLLLVHRVFGSAEIAAGTGLYFHEYQSLAVVSDQSDSAASRGWPVVARYHFKPVLAQQPVRQILAEPAVH